jgi:hypothetical protein
MNHHHSSGPPQTASRASSLGAPAITPSLHRESTESLGGRLRRPGCGGCGSCTCHDDAEPKAAAASRKAAGGAGVTGWLADRPWIFVVGAFSLLIGVWTTFITLALLNPPRDVLKNPLPTTADVRSGH